MENDWTRVGESVGVGCRKDYGSCDGRAKLTVFLWDEGRNVWRVKGEVG